MKQTQIESNIIRSFNLAKQDIEYNCNRIKELEQIQTKILNLIEELRDKTIQNEQNIHKSKNVKPTIITKTVPKKKKFIASKKGDKFHTENCPYAKNIKKSSKIQFNSKLKALTEGFQACACAS
jgi:hypothetical protein